MVFECSLCNFSTKLRSNFNRHLKTKKHLNNVEEQNDSDPNYSSKILHPILQNPPKSSKIQNIPPKPSKILQIRIIVNIVINLLQEKII